jgi:hypothetical protein
MNVVVVEQQQTNKHFTTTRKDIRICSLSLDRERENTFKHNTKNSRNNYLGVSLN